MWPMAPYFLGAQLAAFFEVPPPPRLHRCCLHRGVGYLQAVPQGVVVGIAEVGVGLPLEGGELSRDLCKVSGYVADGVGIVPGSGV